MDGVTFQPILNVKSEKMLMNKKRVPIHEREVKSKVIKD